MDTSYDNGDDEVLVTKTTSIFEAVKERVQQADREGRVICIDHDKQGEDPTSTTCQPSDPYEILGRRICKEFPGNEYGGGEEDCWYYGSVREIIECLDGVDDSGNDGDVYYHVEYDDGDQEDMTWPEIKPCLQEWERRQGQDEVWKEQQKRTQQKEEKKKKRNQLHDGSVASVDGSGNRKKYKKQSTSATTPGGTKHVHVKTEKGCASNSSSACAAAVVTPPRKAPRPPPPRFVAEEWIDSRDDETTLECTWILEMARWLEGQDMSRPNGRTILRQVQKLAEGRGVDYQKHWPPNIVFLKNVQIDLEYDFEQLRKLAVRYQQTYGEDKGHGWLLTHPLKKLQLFQQYKRLEPRTDVRDHPMFVSHVH